MTTITFDTHKFIKRLESAGVPAAQAEAMAEAQREVFAEALEAQIATKADVVELRHELRETRTEILGEMRLNRWMLGIVVGGVVMLALKAFFPIP